MLMRTVAIIGFLAVLGAGAYFGNSYFRGAETPEVNVEPIRQRDLKALVSASGTIQPQLSVDISASVMGRVDASVGQRGRPGDRGAVPTTD